MTSTGPKLKFVVKNKPRKLFWSCGPGSGPKGRLLSLRRDVTKLLRYERLDDLHYKRADEARQYAERLISLAVKYGDRHKPTMEMVDHWVLEKDLIHKLFKVLVPRYENYSESFCNVYSLPRDLPGTQTQWAILELKGNPWPPVLPKQRNFTNSLTNVLLNAAKKDYYEQKGKIVTSSTTKSDDADELSEPMEKVTIGKTIEIDGSKETPL
ncbi:large ribosomal subunit protein bL17m-like [Tubulanus polymorphus]|uniref:large ribosomal subunit protein bL17m-like n=1 Tax=Tubulanus polymorphus TaxID=672921 RepID=UPI003DA439B4